MKKLFYVFIILSFSLGLISCAKTYSKISKSKTVNTVFDNSEASGSTIENSTIEDSSVKDSIDNGSLSTLNSFEEVELAELLISLHPWASRVRFAKTGGEACSIAIRIARAAKSRDVILFCGYHGWHDWYLSANLNGTKNLNTVSYTHLTLPTILLV